MLLCCVIEVWPTVSSKVLSSKDNAVEREVNLKMRSGHMGEAKSLQVLVVDPVQKSTTLSLSFGSNTGSNNSLERRQKKNGYDQT
jgi:hypothetical protein